jgi:hypothetical protein
MAFAKSDRYIIVEIGCQPWYIAILIASIHSMEYLKATFTNFGASQ